MNLPYSDELNIGCLSRLYDNTSNCYKFFWFLAILGKVDEGKESFTFDELINEMIAYAWYMVTEYNLRLGPIGGIDNLEEVVKYIKETYGFSSSEKREKILEFLNSSEDKTISRYKSTLILNVPYRLQAPFYLDVNIDNKEWSGSKEHLTHKINSQERLIYYFTLIAGIKSVVRVDETRAVYLVKHKEILKSWTQLNLIRYLQRRNPGVSGIADKIEVPTSRDLDKARKYWTLIISRDSSIRDIYGDIELVDEKISVDHFVPWQYVAHDELWNLHPTTASINSSKSNNLPIWDKYFDRLSNLEYRAYELMEKDDPVKREFEKIAPYYLNDPAIRNSLYEQGLERSEFQNRLEHVMKPVYESAHDHGFREWEYCG